MELRGANRQWLNVLPTQVHQRRLRKRPYNSVQLLNSGSMNGDLNMLTL